MHRMSKQDIQKWAERLGLDVMVSSPGDGVTRYEIGVPTHPDYPMKGGLRTICYCLGSREAALYLRGVEDATEGRTKRTFAAQGICDPAQDRPLIRRN